MSQPKKYVCSKWYWYWRILEIYYTHKLSGTKAASAASVGQFVLSHFSYISKTVYSSYDSKTFWEVFLFFEFVLILFNKIYNTTVSQFLCKMKWEKNMPGVHKTPGDQSSTLSSRKLKKSSNIPLTGPCLKCSINFIFFP